MTSIDENKDKIIKALRSENSNLREKNSKLYEANVNLRKTIERMEKTNKEAELVADDTLDHIDDGVDLDNEED